MKYVHLIRPWAKAVVASLGAVLVVLNESGLLVDESWFTKAVVIATVLGVYQVKNVPKEDS